MALLPNARLALDTNILFDLADAKDFALTVIEFLREKNLTLKIPPTAISEIGFELIHPSSPEKFQRSQKALRSLRMWDIHPFSLATIQLDIARQFSRSLRTSGMLPEGEINDGCILAEAALCPLEFLLTSDKHLIALNQDPAKLKNQFAAHDLPSVEIISVWNFYRAIP